MATSSQIKALFESYVDHDDDRFVTYALQIAAHEAKLGHGNFAKELKEILDLAQKKRSKFDYLASPTPLIQPKGDLAQLFSASYPKTHLSEMILSDEVSSHLNRIIEEQSHIEQIKAHGLGPRRKMLLVGPPGTGKTMTAFALAGELQLPLFVIRIESIITKFMGETAAKLRSVFDALQKHRGVYLFDEFDSIGAMRTATNDVGEIRRVLNSFLQFIDGDDSNSMILAATNHPQILDYALFRRFDDVIEYSLPNNKQIAKLLENRLVGFSNSTIKYDKLASCAQGLSYAEITRACEDAIKEKIVTKRDSVTGSMLERMLAERKKYISRVSKR